MNKKVVVIGGGTGMSTLLKGLKKFPLDITAIVTVSDDGSSTGRLREEFNTPAVGDIRKVFVSLSEKEPLVESLLEYRFNTTSDLNGHAVGNLILTALTDISSSMATGVESLSEIFNLKGKIVPLTEENVILMAKMMDGTIVEGEHNIPKSKKKISKVYYKKTPKVSVKAIEAIKKSDLIILSMGSLYTSIVPNLLCKEIKTAIDESTSKVMYVCNMMTQPGETDKFKVSDHVNLLNKYLGNKKISVVVANNKEIDQVVAKKYETLEQKDEVILDKNNLKNLDLIEDDFFKIEKGLIRHDSLKVSLSIFAYLIKK